MSIILIFWFILYDIIVIFVNVLCFVILYSCVKDVMLLEFIEIIEVNEYLNKLVWLYVYVLFIYLREDE